MKRVLHRPEALRVEAFADDAAELAGTRTLADFDRLRASTASGPGEPIAWRARGESRAVRSGPPQVWLHLHAQGHADLECQRCLEPVRWPLGLERSFLFVKDEDTAEALDAQSEHDVLALQPQLDLFELLEDELLLTLPLVAMHDGCTVTLPQQPVDAAEPVQEESRPVHPFAALSVLKQGEPDR